MDLARDPCQRLLQPGEAGHALRAVAGVRAVQVVEPLAGMGVEVQEALGLLLQGADELHKGDVLMHVREVSRVESVFVLHFPGILAIARHGQWTVPALLLPVAKQPATDRVTARRRLWLPLKYSIGSLQSEIAESV